MITLIGASHFDLDGYDRLSKLLNYLKPSVIGVESLKEDFVESSNLVRMISDPKIFANALENAKNQFPEANKNTVEKWLSSIYYEERAIGEYSSANNVPIVYCDDPRELEKYDFDSAAKNPGSSLNQEVSKFLQYSLEEARLDLHQEYLLNQYPVNDCKDLVKFYQTRDKHTEKILRKQKEDVVYVCGLDHIYGDYTPNLFDRLSDLNPKRMKLSDADKL